jgi:hypothetical protein
VRLTRVSATAQADTRTNGRQILAFPYPGLSEPRLDQGRRRAAGARSLHKGS